MVAEILGSTWGESRQQCLSRTRARAVHVSVRGGYEDKKGTGTGSRGYTRSPHPNPTRDLLLLGMWSVPPASSITQPLAAAAC